MLSVVTLVDGRSKIFFTSWKRFNLSYTHFLFTACVPYVWTKLECVSAAFFPSLFLNVMFIRFSIWEWSDFRKFRLLISDYFSSISCSSCYRPSLHALVSSCVWAGTHFNSSCLQAIIYSPNFIDTPCKRKFLNEKWCSPNSIYLRSILIRAEIQGKITKYRTV